MREYWFPEAAGKDPCNKDGGNAGSWNRAERRLRDAGSQRTRIFLVFPFPLPYRDISMDISECIDFANANPVTYIATTDGDQPRVRAFAMWFADKTGFYYHTGTPKSVYSQLLKNPKAELCFYAPDPQSAGRMMRVSGEVEFLHDKALEERLYRDRPWVKDLLITAPKGATVAIFRVAHGEAYFWTMEYNMRERDAPRVRF
ncbi:MAG: Pyridoxamine 5'-phosphate oxidase [Euryarchaeota archaeon ADurb.BinA087]|nr:MAG: Pyridoxamine 5'-phosphate oxidase [Euryarchaeota archaeon ADurb.BinA087]